MTVTENDPGSVVLRALAARDQLNFTEVARLCDRDSLQEFARGYVKVFAPVTAAHLRGDDPSMTDAEVKRLVRSAEERVKKRVARLPDALGVETLEELTALEPEEFGRRWLERVDTRWITIQRLRELNRSIPQELVAAPHHWRYEVLRVDPVRSGVARVEFRRASGIPNDERKGVVQSEELSFRQEMGWRLRFRARLLQPEGELVEYASEAIVEALPEDFRP